MTTATLDWRIVCIFCILISFCSLLFYVWQVNDLTRGTYLVNNYEKELDQLTKEKSNLEISFAESSFLGGVNSKISQLNFQKTASVKYIQILDSSVAKAK